MSNETNKKWYMTDTPWLLTQSEYRPDQTIYSETVLSQANGHMGIRAYTEERSTAESVREGYLAGVFSHLGPKATELAGPRAFPVSEMIAIPEIFACEIELAEEKFNPDTGQIVEYERVLDMSCGVLRRTLLWKSPRGHTTRIGFERFLSAACHALVGHRISIAAIDWDGEARLTWKMDCLPPTLVRFGAKRFPQHPQDHLRVKDIAYENNTGSIHLKTRGTNHDVAIAASVKNAHAETDFPEDRFFRQTLSMTVTPGDTAYAERCLAVVSSRQFDDAYGEARSLAKEASASSYDACLQKSREVWQARWKTADIQIDGPAQDQKVVRYNIFQLLQMAPWHSERMSLGARALSFNRYRGTYFWDTEIFILPYYSYVFPDAAKNLLAFRYHTLEGARETAVTHQAKGALYPWMADADRGEDHSLFNLTKILWHQTADIVYALGQYADASGDLEFMAGKGMEILAETARYWQSKIVTDDNGAGHIDGAVGPDETSKGGRDNGYTNLLARHNLRLAAKWHERLTKAMPEETQRLNQKIDLTADEATAWFTAAEKLTIPLVPDSDIPLQDDQLLHKKTPTPEVMAFRENPSAGENPRTRSEYRVIKQADIILAMLLLRDEFSLDEMATAYDFYEPMTLHISSLSRNTHAVFAAMLGRPDAAYDWFLGSAAMDLDNFNNCTADGLHAAAIGGCWQAIVLGFCGMTLKEGQLTFRPNLPSQWRAVEFCVTVQGEKKRVRVDKSTGVEITPEID